MQGWILRRPLLWFTVGLVLTVGLGLWLRQGALGIGIRTAIFLLVAILFWANVIRGRKTVRGSVLTWHPDEGWGLITSPEVPGSVWAHFSSIKGSGFRSLSEGEAVEFDYRPGHQDGYSYVALSVRRSSGSAIID